MLTTIRDQFEVTIIDAPPVLPVADAMILARLFGGAIMVVSERRVRVREVQQAVERMALVGAPILGTISHHVQAGSPQQENAVAGTPADMPRQLLTRTDPSDQAGEGRPVTKLHHPRGASISARVHGG